MTYVKTVKLDFQSFLLMFIFAHVCRQSSKMRKIQKRIEFAKTCFMFQ